MPSSFHFLFVCHVSAVLEPSAHAWFIKVNPQQIFISSSDNTPVLTIWNVQGSWSFGSPPALLAAPPESLFPVLPLPVLKRPYCSVLDPSPLPCTLTDSCGFNLHLQADDPISISTTHFSPNFRLTYPTAHWDTPPHSSKYHALKLSHCEPCPSLVVPISGDWPYNLSTSFSSQNWASWLNGFSFIFPTPHFNS